MVHRFQLEREHPEKEWWRERRIAPATFFGFPDPARHGLRGGSLYVEQMDSVTLAVLADRCLKEKVWDPEIWSKFAWRAQQIVSRTHEPDLCYIFRAFARADWFDQNLLTTYLGRLHRRLHAFQLPDVAVFLEAFGNPKFRQSTYLQKALTHTTLLLQHRDDAQAEHLARTCAALRDLKPLPSILQLEVLGLLELLAEALLLRELSELGPARTIHVMDCFVAWGLVSRERSKASSASIDLCWALARELKGRLRDHAKEHPDHLATLALTLASGGLAHEELWDELVYNLGQVSYKMSASSVAAAASGVARSGRTWPALFEAFGRRLVERRNDLGLLDCARAAGGFLRCPTSVAERFVTRGPVGERLLELGLETLDAESTVMLLDGLSRAPPGAHGVETLAGALLEASHMRLRDFSAKQLCIIARSLGHLRPAVADVLRETFDCVQEVVKEATSNEGVLEPRYIAMLCRGLSSQTTSALPDRARRLQQLLPEIGVALRSKPTCVTTVQLLHSLVLFPASEERDASLEICAGHIAERACDLSAATMVPLTESLATLADHWTVPSKLVLALAHQLDIKRYDLRPGTLFRAARALEAAGAREGTLRLEPRDSQQ